MLIAILYTGEFRTCEKTIYYTKNNILLNENVHVFATIQSTNIIYSNAFIKNHMSSNLKSLTNFDKTDILWNSIQDKLLSKLSINNKIYNYLKKSGSMIEHYQIYLSYKSLLEYEFSNNIKYDYIVKLRTDVIYTQPLNFNFMKITLLDIIDNFQKINKITNESKLLSLKNIKIFFNNLLFENDKNLRNSENYANLDIHSNYDFYNLLNENEIQNENYIFEKIFNFINNGKYIITLRKNVFIVIKRDFFSEIVNLGITYGSYIKNKNILNNDNDEYWKFWWNSESQLQEICRQKNICIFDSTTILEDKSLYKYNSTNYFNENNKLLENLQCLFFICRN